MNKERKAMLKARIVALLVHDATTPVQVLFARVKPEFDKLNEQFGKDAVTAMLNEVVQEAR